MMPGWPVDITKQTPFHDGAALMARRQGRGGGGRSRHRDPGYRTTCKGCGTIETVIVRPPAGIDLYCVPCDTKRRAAKEAAAVA